MRRRQCAARAHGRRQPRRPHLGGRRQADHAQADRLARAEPRARRRVLDLAATMPDGLVRIDPGGPDVWAQAAYAVEAEWACTAADIARRRTTLAVRGLLNERIAARLAAIAYSRGRGAAGIGAAKDRRADSSDSPRAAQRPGDHAVRAGSR
ncbi:MAG: hypothetical protein E6I77_02620 [Chloroflexi bacterium]|nr:MAG: hypothetical protein E6I77_02620 [Chloroflexota bacterium]